MYTEIKIPEPLSDVMSACEVHCLAECCGLNAFDINPIWIRRWMEAEDPSQLIIAHEQLEEIIRDLYDFDDEFSISMLNVVGSSDDLMPIFTEWKAAIEKAPNSPLPPLPQPYQPPTPAQEFRRLVKATLMMLSWGMLGALPLIAIIVLIEWLLGWLK